MAAPPLAEMITFLDVIQGAHDGRLGCHGVLTGAARRRHRRHPVKSPYRASRRARAGEHPAPRPEQQPSAVTTY